MSCILQKSGYEVVFVVRDELLTREEAAGILKISLVQLYRLTREGEIAVVKRGSRFVRYRRNDIDEFINRYLSGGPNAAGGTQ